MLNYRLETMIFQPIANQQIMVYYYNTIFNFPYLVFNILTIIVHKHPEEKGALQVTARHQVYNMRI